MCALAHIDVHCGRLSTLLPTDYKCWTNYPIDSSLLTSKAIVSLLSASTFVSFIFCRLHLLSASSFVGLYSCWFKLLSASDGRWNTVILVALFREIIRPTEKFLRVKQWKQRILRRNNSEMKLLRGNDYFLIQNTKERSSSGFRARRKPREVPFHSPSERR